jgi:hypothetical protein
MKVLNLAAAKGAIIADLQACVLLASLRSESG